LDETGDYDKEHWYWEVVELSKLALRAFLVILLARLAFLFVYIWACVSVPESCLVVQTGRKLILSGLISLFQRGSIAQTVLATMLSFAFFAIAYREQPFEATRLNVIKVCGEVQIFGILLCCVVLQTNEQGFARELVTPFYYGQFQVYLTMAVMPITAYLLVVGVCDLGGTVREELLHVGEEEEEASAGDEKSSQMSATTAGSVAKQKGQQAIRVSQQRVAKVKGLAKGKGMEVNPMLFAATTGGGGGGGEEEAEKSGGSRKSSTMKQRVRGGKRDKGPVEAFENPMMQEFSDGEAED
jgi:hypothetical protein